MQGVLRHQHIKAQIRKLEELVSQSADAHLLTVVTCEHLPDGSANLQAASLASSLLPEERAELFDNMAKMFAHFAAHERGIVPACESFGQPVRVN